MNHFLNTKKDMAIQAAKLVYQFNSSDRNIALSAKKMIKEQLSNQLHHNCKKCKS